METVGTEQGGGGGRRPRVDDLVRIVTPEQVALSPDASSCVYVVRSIDTAEDRTARSIWCVGSADGDPFRLTDGPGDSSPAWSPDGTTVAFLRASEGPPQIWLVPAGGGEAEQLTTMPLGAGAPSWSPDGSSIAFAAAAIPDLAAQGPIVTDTLGYQLDGIGFLGSVRRHLFVVDRATEDCRQVTSGDWHAGEPAWSPDSSSLAFSAAMAPDADLRYRAPLYTVAVASSAAEPQLAGLADGIGISVTWNADGTALLTVGWTGAFVGTPRLLRVPLDGGETVDLAPAIDGNLLLASRAQLAGDGSVVFNVARRGCTHVYAVDERGGAARPLVEGADRNVLGLSVAGDSAAIVLSTATSFGELVVVDLAAGRETVRTSHGESVAELELYPREEREFTISDGTVVHGWLVRDPDAPLPSPLLLDVHGGPHAAWSGAAGGMPLLHHELAERGWTVLLLNPRGSSGYGAEFYDAITGAWGETDASDLLEPIDQLVAEGIADPARLAVTGYSYGGYMTCYLTSRDDRFAAAVAGGGISDMVSYTGTSDSGLGLGVNELGAPWWDARDRYTAMSPLHRVDSVRTPTLIYHAANDLRCPLGQAQQWFMALRGRRVPTRLVIYPDASHAFVVDGRPSYLVDVGRRTVDWVEQYAGSGRETSELQEARSG